MKKFLLLAASTMALMTFIPEPADAQVRRGGGVRAVGPRGGVVVARRGVVRPGVRYGARGYGYRRGGGWGVPAAVGLGVLGAAAVGAAAYGYSRPVRATAAGLRHVRQRRLAARARLLSRRRPPDTRKARETGPFPFCPQLSSLPSI